MLARELRKLLNMLQVQGNNAIISQRPPTSEAFKELTEATAEYEARATRDGGLARRRSS